MCFDGLTLSAYIDGELSGIQHSSVEEHLKVCNICREKVGLFESLGKNLEEPASNEAPLIRDAIWARLVHSISASKDLDFWHRGFVIAPSLLISFSFLFLAVIGLGLFLAISSNKANLNNTSYIAVNSDTGFHTDKFPLEIPVDNIEKVLAHFDIHDDPVEVSIQLPGSSNFVVQGKPRFLKKVDYLVGR